jgi:hypothetical protein
MSTTKQRKGEYFMMKAVLLIEREDIVSTHFKAAGYPALKKQYLSKVSVA